MLKKILRLSDMKGLAKVEELEKRGIPVYYYASNTGEEDIDEKKKNWVVVDEGKDLGIPYKIYVPPEFAEIAKEILKS